MYTQNSDLVFNVAQLLKEPIGSTRKLNLDTALLALEDRSDSRDQAQALAARDLGGNIKVTRISDGLLVQGDVQAVVDLECSRCLEQFALPVKATLEEQFQPTIDVDTGMPVHRADYEQNDAAFEIDASHQMDMGEPVRQALLVALPMKPLCREDCKGLCPQCGANWNEGSCDCRTETFDNRWQGLVELRIEDFPADEKSRN